MYKQVIVVRTDLKMKPGKIAAQVAHASVSVLDKADKKIIELWKKEGQKKIVVKAGSLEELAEIKEACEKLKLPVAIIKDAGMTQIKPGTTTALAIGPEKEDKIDKVTGKMKIL